MISLMNLTADMMLRCYTRDNLSFIHLRCSRRYT